MSAEKGNFRLKILFIEIEFPISSVKGWVALSVFLVSLVLILYWMHSFGNNTGLNCLGQEPWDAFKAFLEEPDNPDWFTDNEVNVLKDEISMVYPSLKLLPKSKNVYVPKESTGENRRLQTAEDKRKAAVDPEAEGKPHTQLGVDRKGKYPQRREVDERGNKVIDTDWHGGTEKPVKKFQTHINTNRSTELVTRIIYPCQKKSNKYEKYEFLQHFN